MSETHETPLLHNSWWQRETFPVCVPCLHQDYTHSRQSTCACTHTHNHTHTHSTTHNIPCTPHTAIEAARRHSFLFRHPNPHVVQRHKENQQAKRNLEKYKQQANPGQPSGDQKKLERPRAEPVLQHPYPPLPLVPRKPPCGQQKPLSPPCWGRVG